MHHPGPRALWRTFGSLSALALAVAACSDGPNRTSSLMSPPMPEPLPAVSDPFNDQGVCFAMDAYLAGTTSGVNDPNDLADPTKDCTAEDVKVATTTISQYSLDGITYVPFTGNVTCNEGDPIFLDITAMLLETSTSQRTDIGVWIGLEGSNARTGTCNHYNLVAPGTLGATVGGVTNYDGDQCGDMINAASVPSFPLGKIEAVCQTSGPTSTLLHIGSCLSWTIPGQDNKTCPTDVGGPNGFRFGTVPSNTSKCNCDGFDVNITVNRTAKLEVVKACVPSNDGGSFDLLIDGSNQFADDVGCGGTTDPQEVSAGTNTNPGALHTFGETINGNPDDYTTSYVCTNRVATGPQHAGLSGVSRGPNNITMLPGQDVICTFTNTRKPQLTLVKRIVNNNGGTAVVADFGITSSAGTVTFGAGVADGANTLKYTSTPITVNPSTQYTFAELDVAGYTEGTWDCTPVNETGSAYNAGSVTIGLGQAVTCTITNNDDPGQLTLVKRVVNDNGGTATATTFGITLDGNPASFNAGVADGANTLKYSTNAINVNAGVHNFAELNVAGYTEGTWDCTPTNETGSAYNAGSVNVANGVAVTCTITNDDQPASLTIIKTLQGPGTTFSFPTTSSSSTALPNPIEIAVVTDGSNSYVNNNLNPGTYTVTETVPSGYVLTDLSCVVNGVLQTPAYDPNVTKTVSVTLTNGGTATCTFVNNGQASDVTRTQGFWSTHPQLAFAVWFGGTWAGVTYPGVSDKTICGTRVIDSQGELMGAFWSNIANKSDGKKRTALDQARMRLLQQLVAAILNNAAFGSSPTGAISLAQAKLAFCSTDIAVTNAAASAMAAFNEGGDSGVFTPGGSANPKLARSIANLAIWNVLPGS